MAAKEPGDRRLAAQIAAHARWAKEPDRAAATQPMRDGFTRKLEDEVDPERRLSLEERARRVESARKAHYLRLSLKGQQARRAKREGGGDKSS